MTKERLDASMLEQIEVGVYTCIGYFVIDHHDIIYDIYVHVLIQFIFEKRAIVYEKYV